ncbi:MAG: SDR family NAD(P)-dependent oxidoreductase [Anaerolineae bacterium]
MELGLAGRTAVITGGSMGIGKAAAQGLAAEGVNLALLARGQEALDQTAEEIRRQSAVEVLAVPTDIRRTGDGRHRLQLYDPLQPVPGARHRYGAAAAGTTSPDGATQITRNDRGR